MSLQGPIVVVADKPAGGLVAGVHRRRRVPRGRSALGRSAGCGHLDQAIRFRAGRPDAADPAAAQALGAAARRERRRSFRSSPAPGQTPRPRCANALPVAEDAPVERLITRLRRRCGCARCTPPCCAAPARSCRSATSSPNSPDGDPIEDATVLVVGRGRRIRPQRSRSASAWA